MLQHQIYSTGYSTQYGSSISLLTRLSITNHQYPSGYTIRMQMPWCPRPFLSVHEEWHGYGGVMTGSHSHLSATSPTPISPTNNELVPFRLLNQKSKLAFPTMEVMGCFFHFAQALDCKIATLELQITCYEDATFSQFVHQTVALPFMPLRKMSVPELMSSSPILKKHGWWEISLPMYGVCTR